jgi:hypothetical protein
MKRTALILAALLLAFPHAASAATKPRPVPAVQLVSVTEQCQYGYAWVDVTLKANKAGTYDLWQRGDSDQPWGTFVAETDTLAAGETLTTSLDLPYPQQLDVFVTRSGSTQPLVSRSVAAASSCGA